MNFTWDLNPTELRFEYHALVDDGVFPGPVDMLHKMVDQHVDNLVDEYCGEAELTPGDIFIGMQLFQQLRVKLHLWRGAGDMRYALS